MKGVQAITPCLWFGPRAEDAARHYVGIFPVSRIVRTTRYTEAGHDVHGMPAGSVLTVQLELGGEPFTALNGGPRFHFTPAVSYVVLRDGQDDIEPLPGGAGRGRRRLGAAVRLAGGPLGVSWQVVPAELDGMLDDLDQARRERVMTALMQMKKLDVAALRRAHGG